MGLVLANAIIALVVSFCYFVVNNLSFNGNKKLRGFGMFLIVIFYLSFISGIGGIIKNTYDDINEDSNSFIWELISIFLVIGVYSLFFFYIPSSLANGGIITKGFGRQTWNPFSKEEFFESNGSLKDKLKFGALVLPLTFMNYFFVGIKSLCKFDINNQCEKIENKNLGIIDKYLDPLDYKSLKELKNIDINKFYKEHEILKNIFFITVLCLFIPYILVYITGMTSIFNFLVFCSVGYIMYFIRKRGQDATFFNIYTNGPCGPFDAEKISKNIQKTIDNTIPSLIFPHMNPTNLKPKK
jgi:hypothetical protein